MTAGPRVDVGGPEEEGGDAQPWVWKPDQGQLHSGVPTAAAPGNGKVHSHRPSPGSKKTA